jgi:restriction system protein
VTDELPKYDQLFWPVLKAVASLGGSAGNNEIDDKVAQFLGLTPQQLEIANPNTGSNVFKDRSSWARSFLKFPKFLDNPRRSLWIVTEQGQTALKLGEQHVYDAVMAAAAERRVELAERRAQRQKGVRVSLDDVAPVAQEFLEEESSDWANALLQRLKQMAPDAFERLTQRLLRESGFVRVEVTGKSGDGGIDGHGVLRMNLISFQVLFQCKRYAGSVPAGTVRDFRGAMQGRADKGLIITTGTFTPDARRESTRDGAPAIDLIDGEALVALLKSFKLGVKVEQVISEKVSLDEGFFADF